MDRRKFIAVGLVAGVSLPATAKAPTAASSPSPVEPASRAEATALIAEARKIVTPDGVQRLEKIKIGGIDQWVSIRGTDRRNPVLLHIHGGPGYISMPMSLVVFAGLGRVFHRHPLGSAGGWQDPSVERARHHRADPHLGTDACRC